MQLKALCDRIESAQQQLQNQINQGQVAQPEQVGQTGQATVSGKPFAE